MASRYPPHYKSIALGRLPAASASPCLATHTPSTGATATAPYSPADRALDVRRGSTQTKGEIQYCRHVQQRHHITVESQATAHTRINSADTEPIFHRPGRGRFVYRECIRAPTPTALPPEEKHSAASSLHSALLNTPILPASSCAAGFISQCDRSLDDDICLKIYPPKKSTLVEDCPVCWSRRTKLVCGMLVYTASQCYFSGPWCTRAGLRQPKVPRAVGPLPVHVQAPPASRYNSLRSHYKGRQTETFRDLSTGCSAH